MKENQMESCQKCLQVKTYKWTKKPSDADLIKKEAWRSALKIDTCAAAKHKIISS